MIQSNRSGFRGACARVVGSSLLVLAPATGWIAGCGGNTNGSSSSAPVASSELPAALAHAVCANVGPCCRADGRPFNQEHCEIAVKQIYTAAFEENSREGYDPNAAADCVDAVAATVNQCTFASGSVSPACDGLFDGGDEHGAEGDACNATCERTPGGGTGCGYGGSVSGSADGDAAPPPEPVADPVSCYKNDGLYCSEDGFCRRQLGIGAPCSTSDACADSICDFESGVCAPRRGAGEACGFDDECADANFCDWEAGVCAAKKPNGASCEDSDECTSGECNFEGTCAVRNDDDEEFLPLACAE